MSEQSSDLPRIAAYKPCYQKLEKGKSYLWCSCGLSANQPFCDQSHKGTAFKPVRYVAREQAEEVLFCACKRSSDQPFCDGAHNNLKDVYDEDDPCSASNLAIPVIEAGPDGRAVLDGGCCVCKVGEVLLTARGTLHTAALISAETGAQHQSQFYFVAASGVSPIVSFGDRHVVILITQGKGTISISGRDFQLGPETGIHVQPQEAFSISNPDSTPIKLFVSVSPLAAEPDILEEMPDNFNARYPARVVGIDPLKRQNMADRFFQVLVDESVGSTVLTQFIGEVPLSKAAPHRHLYEESIVVLSGEGYMWTQSAKTPVTAGDVIFLPRKQVHSLECTAPDGMMLAGLICPGNNPSINY